MIKYEVLVNLMDESGSNRATTLIYTWYTPGMHPVLTRPARSVPVRLFFTFFIFFYFYRGCGGGGHES